MRRLLILLAVLFVFFISACDLFSPANNYTFDISKLTSTASQGRAYTTPSQDDKPFCNFAKYQIDVLYIQVSLVTPGGMSEHHTILNRAETDPVVLDLAIQKLSDVIDLSITDAKGYIVSGATIGIGRRYVMNGTLYNDAILKQTTASGMANVSGTAAPEDWKYLLPVDTYTKIETTYMEGEVPIAEYVYGINLNVWGTNNIELSDNGVLELKFPLEQGLQNGNVDPYEPCSLEVPSPYIEGQTNYEIYHAKIVGTTSYYTEWWRFIFDPDGNLINEGGQGGTVTSALGLQQGFGTFMTDESNSATSIINADGTYTITADKDCCPDGFVFTNLTRLEVGESDTVTIEYGSSTAVLDYKRVQ